MDHIKYESFLYVLRLGSLTKAGEALGYTQSGISHLLNGLEQEFGVTLLHRDRSGVRLTSEGKVLLPYIEAICAQQHELDLALNELRGGENGLICISATTSVAGQWLPHIMREFNSSFPKVGFELYEVLTSFEVGDLVERTVVDCGFFVSSAVRGDRPPLYKEQLVAVLSPEHELAGAEYFPMEALDAYPYIMIDEAVQDTETYATCVTQIFAENNRSPKVSLHVISEYAALSMIAANRGYCILPDMTRDRTKRELVYLPLEKPFYRYINLIVSAGRENDKLIQSFVAQTVDWAGREAGVSGRFPSR